MADKDEKGYLSAGPMLEASADTTFKFEVAEGSEGLWSALEKLLSRCQEDPSLANQDHYIMYVLGGQRSLIQVNMSEQPFEFWFCDKYGRPPTKAVKETIARFVWQKGGEKERFVG